MSNDSKVKNEMTAIERFEEVAKKFDGIVLAESSASIKQIFVMADAMLQLESVLTDEIMEPIMRLSGRRVGFLTDRDKDKDGKPQKPYSVKEVREVVMDAIVHGARMTNNEVNIIAGGMYAAKNYFVRKVKEIPGLTDLKLFIGTPQLRDGATKVKCSATWKMNGVEQSIGLDEKMPCVFTVRVNKYMGDDATVGKATKKMYKKIYETIIGSEMSVPEGDIDNSIPIDAKIVERASVDIDEITAGDPATHTPVDAPLDDGFETAYSDLSSIYDDNARKIDDLLFKNGADVDLIGLKEAKTKKDRQAVIKTAKEMYNG